MVLAGGEGKRLAPLTNDRAKPAVPFGGSYRLIDFALSNFANAGYLKIVVLTQYKSHSLDRHISQTWRFSTMLEQLRDARPGPDAARPVLVQRLGGRDLPEPQPHLRRAPRLRLRLRRRPHLPHGPAADGRAPHRLRLWRHRRGDPGVDRGGARVRRDRGRRVRPHRRLPREGRRSADDARRPDALPRLDGQLRLRHEDADRGGDPARRRLDPDRPRRRRHPGTVGPGARAGLRLLAQRDSGAGRARARVLARRRDARRVLRGEHGPDRPAADLQPLQRPVARLHAPGAAAAREGVGEPHHRRLTRLVEPALPGVDRQRRRRGALDHRTGQLRRPALAHHGFDPLPGRHGRRRARVCGGASSTRT